MKSIFQTSCNLLFFSVKQLLGYSIRFDMILVYALSRPPFFLLWIVIIALGFFAGEEGDFTNFCCLIFATYVAGTSILIYVLCNTPKSLLMVVNIIGLPFVERFAPKKGRDNLLIIVLPIIVLLILEVVSIQYQVNSALQESRDCSSLISHLVETGQIERANEAMQTKLDNFENFYKIKGLVAHSLTHPFMIYCHSLLSKVLGL